LKEKVDNVQENIEKSKRFLTGIFLMISSKLLLTLTNKDFKG